MFSFIINMIRNYITRIKRILLISSKPGKEEFVQIVKITGIGAIVIGFIGFVIFLIAMLLGGF